jgi:pimeloyl-ACP methyl ester carboxylesterase
MDMDSYETAPTNFVQGKSARYAYRTLGKDSAERLPLVLLQHFTGTLDGWDPIVVNGLARQRKVIAFDNTGVASSSGSTPDNVAQMALDAFDFISAMGLNKIDLLGYSLGGMVAQQLAVAHRDLFRRIMLVGTAPQGGEEHLMKVLAEARAKKDLPDTRLDLFFTKSDASRKAGRAYLGRIGPRTVDPDLAASEQTAKAQAAALIGWCATEAKGDAILREITHPVLIVNGSNDTMLPAANSYAMFEKLPNAQLILYPDAGHGSLFQYPDTFVAHADIFLRDGRTERTTY